MLRAEEMERLKEILGAVFSQKQTEAIIGALQVVIGTRLLELPERVDRLEKAIIELAEAQKRTEQRVEELARAQAELAQAQKRTEQRVEELARAQAELAQAQKRTEQRVEELAQAQKRTEQRVEELARAQAELAQAQTELAQAQKRTERALQALAKQVGGLSQTVGGDIEDIAYIVVHDVLEREKGWQVGVLERSWQRWDGLLVEVDLLGKAEIPGPPQRTIWIVGEAKHNLTIKDVDRFSRIVELARRNLKEEVFPVCFCYRARPEVRERIKELGFHLVFSYGRLL